MRGMTKFIEVDRRKAYELPLSVDDWLNEDHLARFVVEVVDQLDLSKLTSQYAGKGSPPYHPKTLLAILVYGYASGVFSSRRLERATYDSVAFRFIATNMHPDHDTLATFRRRCVGELSGVFVQVLVMATEMKLLKLGTVAERAAKQDKTGKKPGGRPPEPPAPGARQSDQINLTDEESRIMPVAGGGFDQAYNAQAAVDAPTMLVVAAYITQAPNDKEQIKPALAVLQAQSEASPGLGDVRILIADTGYCSQANIQACKAAGVEPMIALARQDHHPAWQERHSEPPALGPDATPVQAMVHKLKTKAGRATYALRKQVVEPVFGIIKSVMGFRQFSLRGLHKVSGEWTLVCLAWNFKRLAVLRSALA
jgi:transposase